MGPPEIPDGATWGGWVCVYFWGVLFVLLFFFGIPGLRPKVAITTRTVEIPGSLRFLIAFIIVLVS